MAYGIVLDRGIKFLLMADVLDLYVGASILRSVLRYDARDSNDDVFWSPTR